MLTKVSVGGGGGGRGGGAPIFCHDAYYDRGAPLFFLTVLKFGSSRHVLLDPKTDLENN